MTNHPNRSRRRPSASRNPSPEEVRAAREASQLTVEQAAALVHTRPSSWQQWEAPKNSPAHRRMHPAFFELFNLKRVTYWQEIPNESRDA